MKKYPGNPAPPATPSVVAAKKLVLIVDDVAENLQVLAGHLTGAGYEILAASNGPRALELVSHRRPDLILLDIIMPEMDGFAVCHKLKADADLAEVPLIFITARTDTDDVVRGFEAGAVDYVTKPFKSEELLARVRTHIELKSARDLFVAYNEQLKRMSTHLQRLNEDKNRLLSIVSHDIRGAFGNVISVSRYLADTRDLGPADTAQLLADMGIEAEHMIDLAQNLLNIEAIERQEITLKREPVASRELLDFCIQAHQMAALAKDLQFNVQCDDSVILGDVTACRQVVTNLVSNAVKYCPPASTVWIEARADEKNSVQISLRDEGPGLSIGDQKKLFLPFSRLTTKTSASAHSVGLGLSIVKLMTEGMGGTIACESSPGNGATFILRLPAA